jgi:hypothetical protein
VFYRLQFDKMWAQLATPSSDEAVPQSRAWTRTICAQRKSNCWCIPSSVMANTSICSPPLWVKMPQSISWDWAKMPWSVTEYWHEHVYHCYNNFSVAYIAVLIPTLEHVITRAHNTTYITSIRPFVYYIIGISEQCRLCFVHLPLLWENTLQHAIKQLQHARTIYQAELCKRYSKLFYHHSKG